MDGGTVSAFMARKRAQGRAHHNSSHVRSAHIGCQFARYRESEASYDFLNRKLAPKPVGFN